VVIEQETDTGVAHRTELLARRHRAVMSIAPAGVFYPRHSHSRIITSRAASRAAHSRVGKGTIMQSRDDDLPPGDWISLTFDALGIHLQVPAHLVTLSETHTTDHVVLACRDPATRDFDETLDLFRHRPQPDEVAPTWRSDIDTLAVEQGWEGLVVEQPVPLVALGVLGTQVRFLRRRTGASGGHMDGLAWAGEVQGEHVGVVYQCAVARAAGMAATLSYLLGTLRLAVAAGVAGLPRGDERAGSGVPRAGGAALAGMVAGGGAERAAAGGDGADHRPAAGCDASDDAT
jgi:hypothetical protein